MSNADRASAIEKIKKCLALSSSANEHEAATAMRQARKLMEKFSLTEMAEDFFKLGKDQLCHDFTNPPAWYFWMGNAVGRAFGC